jgi:hypothetical protein
MNIEISINTNEFVECELTASGKDIANRDGVDLDFKGNTDFIKIQLWQLMSLFGAEMFNGSDQFIVDNRITYIGSTIKPWS